MHQTQAQPLTELILFTHTKDIQQQPACTLQKVGLQQTVPIVQTSTTGLWPWAQGARV